MNETFRIDFDWLSHEFGSPIEKATLADLEIHVNGVIATRVEDLLAKSLRTKIRVSAYHLAFWLAQNWWRILWEPGQSKNLDWEMAHKVGAAGGGYAWPELVFSSDGETVLARSRPTSMSPVEPVRYLENFDISIPRDSFEGSVAWFIDGVCARLASQGIHDSDLERLWADVQQERRDREGTAWRRVEAILGCDPDQADEGVIRTLLSLGETYGIRAVEEIAAQVAEDAPTVLKGLWDDVRPNALSARLVDRGRLRTEINRDRLRTEINGDAGSPGLPWPRAGRAAAITRRVWGIANGPVSTSNLLQFFEMNENQFSEAEGKNLAPVSAGFPNEENGTIGIHVNKKHPTSRRFALARVIADYLAEPQDKILPATNIYTARQKFQRAFAQEFLCPFEELKDFLGTDDPSDEDIESAADHFLVSPLTIRTTLVNRHLIGRESLVA